MEFVGQPLTGTMLRNAQINSIGDCNRVLAAIAYASSDTRWWFEDCIAKNKHVEFFGRYDGSCPIDPTLLKWVLDRNTPNLSWRVVPKWLHAKVIWWEGKGAYIGSANLTDRAWNSNYEAGVFLSDSELEHAGLVPQLLAFFDGLRANSEPLRKEHYESQLALERRRAAIIKKLREEEEQYNSEDPLVRGTGSPIAAKPAKGPSLAMARFAKEWNDTLQHMRLISQRVSLPENRPDWIQQDVPGGIQADQFLHGYYYRVVKSTKGKDAYLGFYERNKKDKEAALASAIAWWKKGDFDPYQERHTIENSARSIRDAFAKDSILKLTEDQFVAAMSGVHAFGQHALHVPNAMIGLPPEQLLDAKIMALAHWMWRQRTQDGKSPLEVIHHVVWGGPTAGTVERLWEACNSPQWRIGHMKTSILGELIGWVNPDHFPPRNQRTSKGLKSLGFEVDVSL